MKEYEKEIIIKYLNLMYNDILELRDKANDLDKRITENRKNLSLKELSDLMRERLKMSRRITKDYEDIHFMINYTSKEGCKIIWKGYKAVDIVKKGDAENEK